MASYKFTEIEKKWQTYWAETKNNRTVDDFSKPKYYVLDMFPYPSGTGLHIGHPEGYTATDIVARYKRLKGFNVLHPMGFDAFGLPTERYSMVTGIHPYQATAQNVAVFKRQLNALGLGYDWDREINTTDPAYYKWTQYIFLLIYNSWYDPAMGKARPIEELPLPEGMVDPLEIQRYQDQFRLAFESEIPVNWCEELGTVLANEEVDEWKSKGYNVERRPMRQWMLRITAYAERLIQDLDLAEWPQSTREMQRNWIGRSDGAEITFPALGTEDAITVFTTRPDTVFGATYLVLAPEHPFVDDITEDGYHEKVNQYRQQAAFKSDLERTELAKEKSGVFTGGYALNPASGQTIPVWIADYVLGHYGTGAIMAVPGHDERDHEFAKAFGLPIVQVVEPSDGTSIDIQEAAFTQYGVSIDSSHGDCSISGLPSLDAKEAMIQWLERSGNGRRRVQYRLRDWLFSRQRYWGEPIPIFHYQSGLRRALDADELPLLLPEVSEFKPAGTGESPLALVDSWVKAIDPKTGQHGKFETNTMPQWAGSCWYYLRYLDPRNFSEFVSKEKEQYWMGSTGVDLYVGGAEHAVLHLLYARFWHKVLFDYGLVSTTEPFAKVFHQGLILGENGVKMSKSLGNVVNPDDIIAEYGADSLRIFEMFMGPLEASKPWKTNGVDGVLRFLNRVWRLVVSDQDELSPAVVDRALTPHEEFVLHTTIRKVSDDIESLSFNTAVSQMMIFVNEFTGADTKPKEALLAFIRILAPFAPHLCEELWSILGHKTSVFESTWPSYDESKTIKAEIEIVLQVNSKIKAKAMVPVDADEAKIESIAMDNQDFAALVAGKTIRKKIIVANKLVNFIVG